MNLVTPYSWQLFISRHIAESHSANVHKRWTDKWLLVKKKKKKPVPHRGSAPWKTHSAPDSWWNTRTQMSKAIPSQWSYFHNTNDNPQLYWLVLTQGSGANWSSATLLTLGECNLLQITSSRCGCLQRRNIPRVVIPLADPKHLRRTTTKYYPQKINIQLL